MAGKFIAENNSPVTQSNEAVKALLTFQGKDTTEMAAFYRMAANLVLVRSNKGDVYYVTTPQNCSCPSQSYREGRCKHMRRYFPQEQAAIPESDSIRPDMHGFRPFSLLPGEKEEVVA